MNEDIQARHSQVRLWFDKDSLLFPLSIFLCFSNPFIPPKAWLVSIHQGKENLSYQKEEKKIVEGELQTLHQILIVLGGKSKPWKSISAKITQKTMWNR